MDKFLGVDIGSVACSFVLINKEGTILKWDYRFHHGQIEDTLRKMLSGISLSEVRGTGATTSTPESFICELRFDNQVAVITAAWRLHPDTRTLLVVGGEIRSNPF